MAAIVVVVILAENTATLNESHVLADETTTEDIDSLGDKHDFTANNN